MGKSNNLKRQNYGKLEEEKANRLFKSICIALLLLAAQVIVGYELTY